MKEYDKSSLIGFALIILIWIIFNTFFFENNIKEEIIVSEDQIESSIIKSNEATISNSISSNINKDTINDVFKNAAIGENQFETLENEKIKLTINNQGGQIKSVILKEFKTYDGKPLDLFSTNNSKFNLLINNEYFINSSELYFDSELYRNSLSMKLNVDANHYIEYIYTINEDYLIDFEINL